jgi:hypothetical protein
LFSGVTHGPPAAVGEHFDATGPPRHAQHARLQQHAGRRADRFGQRLRQPFVRADQPVLSVTVVRRIVLFDPSQAVRADLVGVGGVEAFDERTRSPLRRLRRVLGVLLQERVERHVAVGLDHAQAAEQFLRRLPRVGRLHEHAADGVFLPLRDVVGEQAAFAEQGEGVLGVPVDELGPELGRLRVARHAQRTDPPADAVRRFEHKHAAGAGEDPGRHQSRDAGTEHKDVGGFGVVVRQRLRHATSV